MHATGLYPGTWRGRRFNAATKAWVAGVTGESTRDNPQRVLLGSSVGQLGTGTIPRSAIINTTAARGINGLVDTVLVRHVSGGTSQISFKTYEKGREKWQGETLHWVWFDEEPPLDIYTEGLTRTNVHSGITFITFTPLLGMSDVVMRFIGEARTPGCHVTNMTIDDALHYTDEQRQQIIASYPAHEREARVKGVPMLGSGRVFPISEEAIAEDEITLRPEWPRIVGIDFGWDHPFAAVWMAWDRDSDTVHIYDCYRAAQESANMHAPMIRARGEWIPVAWPHDGLQHDKGSGEQLADIYRKQGLNMLAERATFHDGTNGVEAGVMDMLTRMETRRLRVNRKLSQWFEEFRLYHREDGKLVKERDDLISATRYGIMMLRHAETNRAKQQIRYKSLGTI